MLSAGSVHSCFTAVASIFCRPNIYCGFAQCQDNVKTRREYWRKKPAGKSPAKMDWFEGVGSKTLATSKWEGKAVPTSVWCQINCVLLRDVFSSSTESLRFDNSTWLVCWWPEQTNPAFHRGSGNTAADGTPTWQCLCLHQTFLVISTWVCRQKIRRKLSFFLQQHFKC